MIPRTVAEGGISEHQPSYVQNMLVNVIDNLKTCLHEALVPLAQVEPSLLMLCAARVELFIVHYRRTSDFGRENRLP